MLEGLQRKLCTGVFPSAALAGIDCLESQSMLEGATTFVISFALFSVFNCLFCLLWEFLERRASQLDFSPGKWLVWGVFGILLLVAVTVVVFNVAFFWRVNSSSAFASSLISGVAAALSLVACALLVALFGPFISKLALLAPRSERLSRLLFATAVVCCCLLLWHFWLGSRLSWRAGWIAVAIGIVWILTFALTPSRQYRMQSLILLILPISVLVTAIVLALKTSVLLPVWSNSSIAGHVVEKVVDVEELVSASVTSRVGKSGKNVVLITVDTLRADQIALYGGANKMPALNQLASKGSLFSWAFSPSNVTRRSIPSIATGLHPSEIDGRVVGWALKLSPHHVTIGQVFKSAGYSTVGFFCCDTLFGPKRKIGVDRGIDARTFNKSDAELSKAFATWLALREERNPYFAWVHLFGPHQWESASRSGGVSKRYGRSLELVDQSIRQITRAISEEKHWHDTIVVVFSDHGEGLGDHGVKNHAEGLFNSQIRVPLIISGGGLSKKTIEKPVGGVDLFSTILDLAGVSTNVRTSGKSLATLVSAEAAASTFAFAEAVKDKHISSSSWALMLGTFKLIQEDDGAKLFHLPSDPSEETDRSKDFPTLVEAMTRVGERLSER